MKGSIGVNVVQQLRGTLRANEHGAIITISRFTKQAQVDAQKAGLKTISLIDGETLAELILKHYEEIDTKYQGIIQLKKKDIPLEEQFITSV